MSNPILSVCMPTHMDALGVWSTVTNLKVNHTDLCKSIEIVVVDQSGNTSHGNEIRKFLGNSKLAFHSTKYVDFPHPQGSASAKEKCFQEASGRIVLVCDSHVTIFPHALDKLVHYFSQDENLSSKDLICGPMIYDDMNIVSTHLDNVWSGNQWGRWREARQCKCGMALEIYNPKTNPPFGFTFRDPANMDSEYQSCPNCGNSLIIVNRSNTHDAANKCGFYSFSGRVVYPNKLFEIWAQGTGLMACLKKSWVGFPKGMKGFGAEEVIIHEKFRQKGGKVLCAPWLKWIHRFMRPDGVRYNLNKWHHVRNYYLGFKELGMNLDPVYDHFVSLDTKGQSIEEHLIRVHGINPNLVKGKTPDQLYQLHKQQNITEEQWDFILQGYEDPPCSGCTGREKSKEEFTNVVDTTNVELTNTPRTRPINVVVVPTHDTLEEWYDYAHNTPHDINEHCPTLRRLASNCHHVTEFGKRHGVSTVALLMGLIDASDVGKLVSYNPKPYAESDQLERLAKEHYEFRLGNSLETEIEPTEMLFIDTNHRGDHLYLELKKHHEKVSHYIAMHDTVTYGNLGVGSIPPHVIVPGMLYGLRRFLREHPEWTVVIDDENNNGLTVISKHNDDKEKLPSITTMAWNYSKALVNHAVKGGTATEEQLSKRLDICSTCTKRVNDRCGRCGCPIEDKASWKEQECPIGKWAKEGV